MSMDLRQKFSIGIPDAVNMIVKERTEPIACSIYAILSGENVLFLGPPGTAKSLLCRTIAQCFKIPSEQYFEYLMGKFTVPEEVLGPIMVSQLEQDKYLRKVKGYLPTAVFAFLDEVFKANSSICNNILGIMNERVYRNDDQTLNVPLNTLWGASNELPETDNLNAFLDRFLFLLWIDNLSNEGFDQMLTMLDQGMATIHPFISLDELKYAQEDIQKTVRISNLSLDQMTDLRNSLRAEGINVSDRKWAKTIKVLKAMAWLNESDETRSEDLYIMKHIAWSDPNERKRVSKLVMKTIKPNIYEAESLVDAAQKEYETGMKSDVATDAAKANKELKKILGKLDQLGKNATSTEDRKMIAAGWKKVKNWNVKILKEKFMIDVNELKE